jgi:phosphoribosylaminoimidazolecarboxamide formyltransferase/IMP cyclohydrolase
LIFAAKICKHTKSNTIVFAKNNTLVSSGTGQTSRVDALKQAIEKAEGFGFSLDGAVLASDAFFSFPRLCGISPECRSFVSYSTWRFYKGPRFHRFL